MSKHLVVIGDCRNMAEVEDGSVQLVVTSPPYFNVKDYGIDNIGSIDEYDVYLRAMRQVFSECYRILEDGRYCCINVSDVISGESKYPIPSHYVSILQRAGFAYRDDIVWKKPSGVGAKASGGSGKRFGTLIQNPFPMYYYPNNIYEHILIFRKGKFDFKTVSMQEKEKARIDIGEAKRRWSNDIWEMVPEIKNKYNRDTHPAMFPEELPEALIRLYTYPDETVLDPFLGSGTTTKVARQLERNSIGYEINLAYLPIIEEKAGFEGPDPDFRVIIRQNGDMHED
ncbi:site-specific DNA-methyltransferase [Candidatus Micrarchaeota archaeon]|nr:site-specific DNA-methyltransferase [Candidatus Micrarchaeota archaeon]